MDQLTHNHKLEVQENAASNGTILINIYVSVSPCFWKIILVKDLICSKCRQSVGKMLCTPT